MPLDPRDEKTVGSWTPTGPIPPPLRQFGRFPNVEDWLPGDLLLFRAIKPEKSSRQIVAAQEGLGYREADSQWSHVAGFMGNRTNFVCEADTSGVQRTPLAAYVGNYEIKVMRDPALDIEQRYEIILHMLARVGKPYSFGEAFVQYFQSIGVIAKPQGLPSIRPEGASICSQLYFEAYAATTQHLLVAVTPGSTAPCPAALSSSPVLVEVSTRWCAIN